MTSDANFEALDRECSGPSEAESHAEESSCQRAMPAEKHAHTPDRPAKKRRISAVHRECLAM